MAAPAKFTSSRRGRLLALLSAGATLSEGARAIGVSRQTVYQRAAVDPAFALLLDDARGPGRQAPGPYDRVDAPLDPLFSDWEKSARLLERDYSDHWALPDED